MQDGIKAVRRTLPLCVFHPRCEERAASTALEQYRREWDDEKKAFRATDVHDWTAHPADEFPLLVAGVATASRGRLSSASRSRDVGDPAAGCARAWRGADMMRARQQVEQQRNAIARMLTLARGARSSAGMLPIAETPGAAVAAPAAVPYAEKGFGYAPDASPAEELG